MSNKKRQDERHSMDTVIQDFKVSSLSDSTWGNSLPSDSSLMQKLAGYDIAVENMSFNKSLSPGTCPADSTFMENVLNKSQRLMFKKPFDLKLKSKKSANIFESDLKDSEPNTPEHKACLPFHRTKNKFTKTNLSELENEFNLSNENFNSSNSLNSFRISEELENGSNKKSINSKNDSSFLKGPAFQRKRSADRITKKLSELNDNFGQCLESSSDNNILYESFKSSQNKKAKIQEKLHTTLDKSKSKPKSQNMSDDLVSEKMNFVRRRTRKQKQLRPSRNFETDIAASQSDESFSSRPAFQRLRVNKEMNNTNLFDDALELSISHSISKLQSPTLGRLPFKTCEIKQTKEPAGFDSLLNESSETESDKQISGESYHKSFENESARCSTNFDDKADDACGTSTSTINDSNLKNKSYEQDEKSLNQTLVEKNEIGLVTGMNLSITNSSTEVASSVSYTKNCTKDLNNSLSKTSISNILNASIANDGAGLTMHNFLKSNKSISFEQNPENGNCSLRTISPPQCMSELYVEKNVSKDSSPTFTNHKDQEYESQQFLLKINSNTLPNNVLVEPDRILNYIKAGNSSINGSVGSSRTISSDSPNDEFINLNIDEQNQPAQGNSMTKSFHKDNQPINNNVIDKNVEGSKKNYELNSGSLNKTSILVQERNERMIVERNGTSDIKDGEEASVSNPLMNNSFSNDQSLTKVSVKDSERRHCEINDITVWVDDIEPSFVSCTKKNKQIPEGKNKSSIINLSQSRRKSGKRVSFQLKSTDEKRKNAKTPLKNMYEEEKSSLRLSQSLRFSSSISLEPFIAPGDSPSPGTTSNSDFLDICASRDKTLDPLNVESVNNGTNDVSKGSETLQSSPEEIEESNENVSFMSDKELNEDDEEQEEVCSEEDEIENSDVEDQDYERESTIEGSNNVNVTLCNNEVEEWPMSSESTKENSVSVNENCIISKNGLHQIFRDKSDNSFKSNQHEDKLIFDKENSFARSKTNMVRNSNNLPVKARKKFLLKKPGYCTVLNESFSTPPSKRKVKEMMEKIKLSEFKKKPSKSAHAILTEEQIEQDVIEQMLRKRQKQKPVVPMIKTAKLKKPNKYMYSRIYDFIIEKLTPGFGLKSHVKAEEVVMFLNEQGEKIMKKNKNLHCEIVQEMKLKLAQLKIIDTHWDFYQFVMKYFDGTFTHKLYPAAGNFVSPFEPADPMQNVL